jgi:hypothetical protein
LFWSPDFIHSFDFDGKYVDNLRRFMNKYNHIKKNFLRKKRKERRNVFMTSQECSDVNSVNGGDAVSSDVSDEPRTQNPIGCFESRDEDFTGNRDIWRSRSQAVCSHTTL